MYRSFIIILLFLAGFLPAIANIEDTVDNREVSSETPLPAQEEVSPARKRRSIYTPTFTGTFRARYEFLPQSGMSAFKVRDLRVGIEGYVAPIMSYVGEVNFFDWGKIGLVNAFIRLTPLPGLSISMGQQRIPFTLSAHRQPFEQYFVNRNFTAKYGGIRDIGLVAGYAIPHTPLTIQGAFYNSGGIGEHRVYFTKSYGFSARLIATLCRNWFVAASTARQKAGTLWLQNWDIGAYFDNGLWHVEGEYLRKVYTHGAFKAANAFDFFVFRNFPIEKKLIGAVSGALRYDYIGNLTNGVIDEEGKLTVDQKECHRLTAGATLSLRSRFQADIRLNYEKYFYKDGCPSPTDGDRLVLELIAHF